MLFHDFLLYLIVVAFSSALTIGARARPGHIAYHPLSDCFETPKDPMEFPRHLLTGSLTGPGLALVVVIQGHQVLVNP